MTGWLLKATEVSLAFNAGIQAWADAPDAGSVLGIRTGCDEATVHGPVMIGAEGHAVVWVCRSG